MSDRPRVLITNAEERSMLAACRSLQRSGYAVTAASASALACTKWSRACARRAMIDDPRKDSQRFLEQLIAELRDTPHAVLIPGSDSALLAISQGRERLEELTRVGLPGPEVVERVLDREVLEQSAAGVGFAAPGSIRCSDPTEALRAAVELGFPVVLKSAHAASAGEHSTQGAPKSRVVANEGELRRHAPFFGNPLLVQRRLAGELISFGGVIAGGRMLGVAVSLYLRTWPPSAGSVCFSETIEPPRELEERVAKLLVHIGWEGIFELELIREESSKLVAIDLNPRPYGSMALAGAAGVPLAAIWCDWLLGIERESAHARPGCRYRWEDGELPHIAWQARHGNLHAALRPLRPHRRVTHASFERTDPLPLLAQGLYLARKTAVRWSLPSRHRAPFSRR
jgi:predicted ATP-grasp superfamily ATP-dependent carboligase